MFLKTIISLLVTVLIMEHILGMPNNSDEVGPSSLGDILIQDCKTFFASTFFEAVCILPTKEDNRTGGLDICDSHCRCVHGAKWGQCIDRPADGSPGSILATSNQMCKCYYDTEDPNPASGNIFDPLTCLLNALLLPICQEDPIVDRICNTDCVCAHGFSKGECRQNSFCVCS